MDKTWTLRVLQLMSLVSLTLARSSNSALEDKRAVSWGKCGRVPPGMHSPRMQGSNGFAIKVSGNPEYYVPGERYTISLHGKRSPDVVQKFTGFMLVAEPKKMEWSEETDSPARIGVGSFELYGDALTMHSDSCPYAIMHATYVQKAEIQVMWQAPRSGSGCVVFRATVVESRDVWYMDEGGLTRELCEQKRESPDQQGQVLENCCACEEAKYELTFEGIWSRHTHPKNFPIGHPTYFSDIIGASHTPDYRIWEYDGYASEGVHEVAEMGETKILESELKAQSGKIRTIIKARGLFFPNVTEKTFAVFRVDSKHHVMSLLSMLGPSPDWIVGVSALELCMSNCSWRAEKVLNLYPWDAGTDDGISYISLKSPRNQPEKIHKITSTMPNNEESPFYDPTGTPMKPVARLIVTRQRTYEKKCEDSDDAGGTDKFPFPENDCAVTEWTEFTPCSVTCGKGIRTRSRYFLNKRKAELKGCNVKFHDKEDCEETCVGSISCRTNVWGEWTDCSVLCGRGYRERKRTYMNPKARTFCNSDLKQREECVGYSLDCKLPIEDERCAVSEWSVWQPCVETCERGKLFKTRQLRNPWMADKCKVDLRQETPCNNRFSECSLPGSEICSLPKDYGPCRDTKPRWFYNSTDGTCQKFYYGGCEGNANNFHGIYECERVCKRTTASTYYLSTPPIPTEDENRVVDCKMTKWSDWSLCSQTCSSGRKERRRQIEINPKNGGKLCSSKTVQRRKCKENPPCPVDCALTQWTLWSQCSKSCGDGAVQTRTREVKRPPLLGGRQCGAIKEERYCIQPLCA